MALFAGALLGDFSGSDAQVDCAAEWPGAVGAAAGTPERDILLGCYKQNSGVFWGHVLALVLITGTSATYGIRAGRREQHEANEMRAAAMRDT